ncbi:hemin uptake protein HemP [Ideonella livida]|uniref:Hemin uptake protein HemP n=1 Tax=Ideonella livida TaxID=2707176 RepID=A0A7C9TIV6_9BURK|nr:hemin uptake protein HemP [Ideonella livida]NDY91581.1 hemin uptake protein HemP [Ideonella livida]
MSSPTTLPRPEATPAPVSAPPAAPPRWHSEQLLGPQGQAHIVHGDQVYRLSLTALGKLILTK